MKLNSDYQPNQLRDYLRAIHPTDGEFLVSVTRDVSRFREPDDDAEGWLGVIRWPSITPELRGLPSPGPLRQQWGLLLDVMEENGDLGSSSFSPDLLTAYQRSNEAYRRLTEFLRHIGVGALQLIRAELSGDATDKSAAAFASARHPSNRVMGTRADSAPDFAAVFSKGSELYLELQVPSGGSGAVWIGFSAGDDGKPRFYIAAGWAGTGAPSSDWEARWQDAAARLEDELADLSFQVDLDEPYCQIDYELADFVSELDVPRCLAKIVERDLPKLLGTGMLGSVGSTHT